MQTMMQIFSDELCKIAAKNPQIVGLSADVKRSTGLGQFAETFPDRYYEMGISEQNMIGTAAGMALEGLIPVTSTYACFSPGRTWEQIRNSICYHKANVKIIGAHIGVGSGRDGATHQCFEDIALMSCLPEMTIFSPATEEEVRLAAQEAFSVYGPVYIRLSARPLDASYPSDVRHPAMVKGGSDFAVIGTGSILGAAMDAVSEFENKHGVSVAVYNTVQLRPLDCEKIKEIAGRYKAVMSVEEHQLNGGFGSMIASEFCRMKGAPILHRVGVDGQFGASMGYEDLYNHLGLSAKDILSSLEQMNAQYAV